jgi:hypothetical protein
VRVVDLSQPADRLQAEVSASSSAEMLMLVLVVCGDAPGGLDVGAERIAALRDRAGEVVERTKDLFGGVAKSVTHLLGHVDRSGPPRDVESFLRRLQGLDPVEVHLTLLGLHNRGARVADAETLRGAVGGDPAARQQVLDALEEWHHSATSVPALLDRDSSSVKDELLGALSDWAEAFAEVEAEAMGPVRRDASAKAELARQLEPVRLVEAATNGVEFVPQPGIRRVALYPSWFLRPWVVLSEHDDTKVVVHPVADEHLERDRSAPPPQLVKLYKALGDESRLRLLRRLGQGPIMLRDAADELGVAKSTAHHHLAVLRQAGLGQVPARADTAHTVE